MEILVLAALGFALLLTLGVAFLKLVLTLVLIPLKLLGWIGVGLGKLVLLVFFLCLVAFGVALLPVLIPVAIVGGVAVAALC